jgi:Flp pilus assembly protein CpaB
MRRRASRASRALLIASFSLALAATFVLRGHLARLEAAAAGAGPPVPVLVAAVTVARGTPIEARAVRVARLPRAAVPPGALASASQAVGRTAASDLLPGEVLTAARLSAGGPVASLVPPGSRAVAVSVAVPPGAVAPGDRVDVLATYVSADPYTEVVADGVEILRVHPGTEGTTLFLAVPPHVAQAVARAATFGQLTVAVVGARGA